jgi:hypothetical protein
METIVSAIEWFVIGMFALVFATGIVGQVLLVKTTDWATFPSGVSKLGYLAWGIYSISMITRHVPHQHRQTLLVIRRLFLWLFFIAMLLVVANFAVQAI